MAYSKQHIENRKQYFLDKCIYLHEKIQISLETSDFFTVRVTSQMMKEAAQEGEIWDDETSEEDQTWVGLEDNYEQLNEN